MAHHMHKKAPHKAGLKVMKNKTDNYTQQRLTRTVNLSQTRCAIALGKGGSCDPPCING